MPICPLTTTAGRPGPPLPGWRQGGGGPEQPPGVNVCKSITLRCVGKIKMSMHACKAALMIKGNLSNTDNWLSFQGPFVEIQTSTRGFLLPRSVREGYE